MVHSLDDLHGRVVPPTADERRRVQEAMRVLAKPRMTGGAGLAEVEAELRRRFEAAGYRIEEMPFSFSSLPGRFGVPILGAIHILGLIGAALFIRADQPLAALGALAIALVIVGGLSLAAPLLISRTPFGRVETANWLVRTTTATSNPRFLVMAHRDSKSQLVPIAARAFSAGVSLFTFVGLAIVALVQFTSDVDPAGLALGVAVVGAILALPLLLSPALDRSPGALDNASGLATLLGLAERLKDDDEIAFLVTDGEELGLAGARVAAKRLAPSEGIINVDGIDDRGEFLIMERHGFPRRGSAPHLATALFASARVLDLPVRRRDLPHGIQVDHIPFQNAGFPALTVMRGDRRSLWRVHLPADNAGRTTGIGSADAVALLDGALAIRRTPFRPVDGTTLPEGLRPL